jgi:hypothetical protein
MDKMRIPSTWGGSVGVAITAALMVAVVTFGANNIRPNTAGADEADQTTARADRGDRAGHGSDGAEAPDRTGDEAQQGFDAFDGDEGDEHPWEPKEEPAPEEPKEKPKKEPKEEPKAEEPKYEEPKEEPKDEEPAPSDFLGLEAWTKEGKVKLAWSKFTGDGFDYYKVVRSWDGNVTWPMGDNDKLVAVVGDQFSPWAADYAPCGHEFHYRVFAVHKGGEGYVVLAASNVAGAFVECHEEEPPAEPKHMGMDVWQTEDGKVKLAWEACGSESFVYYKVVRSATNEVPTYPLHDGDELLAAIGDSGQTHFVDTDVEPGETWFYRVLSFGEGGVLLGSTDGKAITVE